MDTTREEHHCLCLLGVGLEAHTVGEDAEKVEGLLDEGEAVGSNESIFSVEARQEKLHIQQFRDPVDFHQPHTNDGVDHNIEDILGEGATLTDAVLGFEDAPEVPARLTDQIGPPP